MALKQFRLAVIGLLIMVMICLGFVGCGKNAAGTNAAVPDSVTSNFSAVDTESEQSILSDSSDFNRSMAEAATKFAQNKTASQNFVGGEKIGPATNTGSANANAANTAGSSSKGGTKLKGIWISLYDMKFSSTSAATTATFETMFQNIKNNGYNAVFCHVRANGDAYYPSKYFPFAKSITGTAGKNPGYDPLKIMINTAKKYGLKFHAWINPYRVRTTATSANDLSANDPAKAYLTDGSNRAAFAAGGIYYNPASADVQKLVLSGVKEILENYAVDGIHFDDYFYPTTDAAFDSVLYNAYKQGGGKRSLDDWRRDNVNYLVSAVWRECHKHANVVFGISPSAQISTNHTDENYTNRYADITMWMQNKGYVDYIAPQIYFGYSYKLPAYQYQALLNSWIKIPKTSGVKMYIGLAAYKLGATETKEGDFCNPNGTLLATQAADAIKAGTDGIIVYSYASTVDAKNKTEIANLAQYLNGMGNK